ncbi:MAG: NAD-dependent epimerase/dehydratase family protein, partial [Deltaproteobacteria bacterium]
RSDIRLVSDILGEFDLVEGDVSDLPNFLSTIKQFKIDRIIHMAAKLDPKDQAPPISVINTNIIGTANVLEAARLEGVKRVVFCSTRGVYEDIDEEHVYPKYIPVNEDYKKISSPTKHSLYDATKQFCEHLLQKYYEMYGVDYIALRFGSTFSPGKQARHGPLSLVCKMIENAMKGEAMDIPKGGDEIDDFIYNKDVAEGIVLAAFAKNVKHRFFNIASGKGCTIRDIAEAIKKFYPNAIFNIGPGFNFRGIEIKYSCVYDISRAREELGYEPKYSLEEAMKDYIGVVNKLKLLE